MGLIKKALYIATLGLSGYVFKESPAAQPAEKAAAKPARKPARSKAQAKTSRTKAQAARRRKPQTARASKPAPATPTGNGTIQELERLADLHRRGELSDLEYAAAKATLLGTSLVQKPAEPAPAPAAPFPAVGANIAAARHLADLASSDRGAPAAPISSTISGN
jgi:hypothetical protein